MTKRQLEQWKQDSITQAIEQLISERDAYFSRVVEAASRGMVWDEEGKN
jgi:hypothetical protein